MFFSAAFEIIFDGGRILLVKIIPTVFVSSADIIISLRSPLVIKSLPSLLKRGFLSASFTDMAPKNTFFTTLFNPDSPAITFANSASDR